MRRLLIFCVVLAFFLPSCGSRPDSHWKTFGNPNYIYDMLLVDQTNIWVAGPSGVAHYNTITAETTRYSYPDGLVGAFYRLRLAPDGSILAIGKDVFRFDGSSWKQDNKLFPNPENWVVFDLIFTSDGTPWMVGQYLPSWAAGDEIYRYDGTRWQKMLGGNIDVQLIRSANGKTIWTTTWEGVKYYQNNSWEEIPYPFGSLSQESIFMILS